MVAIPTGNIHELVELRDRMGCFRDRAHAGAALATMLEPFRGTDAIVLAVPAGGIAVAVVVAEQLGLPLDLLVVSKITLPWNTEAGYGAVAFDGTVRLNDRIVQYEGLIEETIQDGIEKTRDKVARRFNRLRGDRPFPDISNRTVVVIDDGLASGFTMGVGVEAVRNAGANDIIVAVPTGHNDAVRRVARGVEAIYCANIRSGYSFAVADAYENWYDVGDAEATELYRRFSGTGPE
jgi:predicted phosphoribosyltransferase